MNIPVLTFALPKATTTWAKGFEIVQNIEHCQAMHVDIPKRSDIMTKNNYNKLDIERKSPKRKHSPDEVPDIVNMDG